MFFAVKNRMYWFAWSIACVTECPVLEDASQSLNLFWTHCLCHQCVYGNKQHWGFQSKPLNSSANVYEYLRSAALTILNNYIDGEEGNKTIVVTDTVISLLMAWFTCCLRLRLAQGLRGMYRLSRNSLGLKDAEPGVTPLLQLLCTVRIICQAGCVRHKASLQRSDQLQAGRLAA